MRIFGILLCAAVASLAMGAADTAGAQAAAQPAAAAKAPPPIGGPISLEQARRVVAAAEAEASRRKVQATIAIVDPAGNLVYFQKATNGPYVAEDYAVKKARSAARHRRSTKLDADRLAAGSLSIAFEPDTFPFAGGTMILLDGKVIGAIGVTGGSDQDVAEAGVSIFK